MGSQNGKEAKSLKTESQADSIQVSVYVTDDPEEMPYKANFGLVNTIKEEIDHLIEQKRLDLPAAECQLVMIKSGESPQFLDFNKEVEHYKSDLTPDSTILKLQHLPIPLNAQGAANLDSLNVSVKPS